MKNNLNQNSNFNPSSEYEFFSNQNSILIDCNQAKEIINMIVNHQAVKPKQLAQAIEHTRTCKECGEYFLKVQKPNK